MKDRQLESVQLLHFIIILETPSLSKNYRWIADLNEMDTHSDGVPIRCREE